MTRPPSFVRFWLPALVWSAVVLALSGEPLSASHTAPIIRAILRFFLPSASPATIDLVHFLTRKTAHVCEYGIMSLLYLRALRGANAPVALRFPAMALGICLLVASLDELHQSFVPSRTGTWHDVVLDFAGALIFQLIALGMMRRSEAPR